MTTQIIPLLGVSSPGYTPELLRTITVNATREGQRTSGYKEAVLWLSLQYRTELATFVFRDGITSTRSFAASAVDGKRAIMIYDFDAQPYGTVRSLNINQDLVLNMDLNDGIGTGGGPPYPEGASRVRGTILNQDGTKADGASIRCYHRDSGYLLAEGKSVDGQFILELPTPSTEYVYVVPIDVDNNQSPPIIDYVVPEDY